MLFLSQIVSDFKRKYLNGNLKECLSDKVVQELEQKSSEMSSFCDLNHKTLNKEDLFDSFTPIVESIPSILKQVQLMQKRSNKIKNQIENENSSVGTLQSQFSKKPVSPTFFPKKLQKRSDCPMCNNPNEKTECHNLKKTLKQLNNCDCEECTKLLSRSRNGPKKELKQRRVDNTAKRQLLPFYDDQSPTNKQSKKTETKKDSNKIKSKNTPKNPKI